MQEGGRNVSQVRIENGIIMYYGNKAGRVEDGCAVVDPMFKGEEISRFLERQRHIREVRWMDGMFDRLMAGGQEGAAAQGLKNVRVWQLKPDVDVYMKFIGYEETCRKFGPPDQENYHAVYDGAAETNDLEALYMKFGNDGSALPAGYRGHSLSMSDVLELYDSTGSSFYYVDRTGFQEMEFAAPQQAQGQTMQL